MRRFLLGATVLTGAYLWSRGARDPREWPKRLPQEFAGLWDAIDDALAAGRRAARREERSFDEQLRRVGGVGTPTVTRGGSDI